MLGSETSFNIDFNAIGSESVGEVVELKFAVFLFAIGKEESDQFGSAFIVVEVVVVARIGRREDPFSWRIVQHDSRAGEVGFFLNCNNFVAIVDGERN